MSEKTHGGPGRGQGRKPLAQGEQTVMFALRLTVAQREKLALLGGAEWVRGKIDKAKTPNTAERREIEMTIYNLSKSGKTVTWTEWKKHDGCGISNSEIGDISAALGPENSWKRKGVTLGDIAAVSKVAERSLARYAKERWQRDDLVTVEYA